MSNSDILKQFTIEELREELFRRERESRLKKEAFLREFVEKKYISEMTIEVKE